MKIKQGAQSNYWCWSVGWRLRSVKYFNDPFSFIYCFRDDHFFMVGNKCYKWFVKLEWGNGKVEDVFEAIIKHWSFYWIIVGALRRFYVSKKCYTKTRQTYGLSEIWNICLESHCYVWPLGCLKTFCFVFKKQTNNSV